ncbi:capsular biosynthesis protein [Altererythrobacter sp. KTW20L]|uniref:capsular biosynthesis protein n=1 Tax=Altererythrobacter sp. KTW20L TaxID=2942210 RepID=UPI0020C01706|nr:capsular biosynthesis protein [Altererythrobacter sp. KTW20L]MCL6251873.1 capsular biosynthesis protein [Altererythrobacter sp. KTW20L]
MTEHSKIPVPGAEPADAKGEKKSLFERAEGMFGLEGYSPAPVPLDLAPPVNRPVDRSARRAPAPQPESAPPQVVEVVVPAVQAAPAVAAPVAPPAPVAPDAPRIDFSAREHPVDRALLERHGLIDPEGPVTALLEEFRIVKRSLLKSARADATGMARRVLVCSPLPNEGKTFCATNLALAMAAERDCEVVLVDADVAKPSLLSLLGLPKGPGLMDALANPSIQVEDCVIATDIPGLYVLPAGHQTNADSEYLASERTVEVLARLMQGAPERMVVFDSPPALAASPAADLAHHVGQALVVTRADKTGQSALEDALTLLSNCPDIKLLLNDAHFSPSGRRFGAYYGYGG